MEEVLMTHLFDTINLVMNQEIPANLDDIDLKVEVNFPEPNRKFKGVPLIKTGYHRLEEVKAFTKLGILSAHVTGKPFHDQLVHFYLKENAKRTIYPIEVGNDKAFESYVDVKTKVWDRSRYVRLDIGNAVNFEQVVKAVQRVKDIDRATVVIGGPALTQSRSAALVDAGVDIVALGTHDGTAAVDVYRVFAGTDIDPIKLIANNTEETPILADVWARNPAHIAKAFALGADFVGVGHDMIYGLDETLVGLKMALAVVGVKSLEEFLVQARLHPVLDTE
jgi:hypothetical protein